jgi:hypothetical protein
MSEVRRIGLSLGADLCWPICYEEIFKRLRLDVQHAGEPLTFEVERVPIEPFDIRGPCKYDVVIDRLTHWYHTRREWIKKSIIMDGLYVFNNPWSLQSMEKQTTYCAMAKLGMPVPTTWMVPPKRYERRADLKTTLKNYAKLFDLGELGRQVGYPLYMKPYDGGAWKGVSRIDNESALRAAYEQSGTFLMHLQKAVEDYDEFVRCIGVGPQFHPVCYRPAAPLHDRYAVQHDFLSDADRQLLEDMTMTINSFFGWDFNSCEGLRCNGTWFPIDFANACPDSQVTALHYHFPWLVTAILRWSIFCAATKKKMKMNVDWQPFFDILDTQMSYREKLAAYAAIGHQRMETDRFREFCDTNLAQLDEVADEFFGSPLAKEIVQRKVVTVFPNHEIEEFTELFWQRIQTWRTDQASMV